MRTLIARIPLWFSLLLLSITLIVLAFMASDWLPAFFIIGLCMAWLLWLVDTLTRWPDDQG